MSKKNVISDFSALKGKISFSEDSPMQSRVKDANQVKGTQRALTQDIPTDSNNALKVGQTVVLMDSDLRGKIISLGKTVKIVLEDGLEIRSAKVKFCSKSSFDF